VSGHLTLPALLVTYALMLLPLALFVRLRLGLVRVTLVALVRMSVQLALVGLYLKWIFELNRPGVTAAWMGVMLLTANYDVLGKAGLRRRLFFSRTLMAIGASVGGTAAWFVLLSIRPDPPYDARYAIPIVGMLLGNTLRSNVLGLERFYGDIRRNEAEFETYLLLGAALDEAVRPYLRTAMRAAINPSLATMASMGIVSLPGMMTGQLLGGASPTAAIEYQIGIMISIFVSMVLAVLLNVRLTLSVAFDAYGRLRSEIFR